MSYQSPSISTLIIATLCSAKSSYRFHMIVREREFVKYKKESIRVTMSRLSKKGLLKNSQAGWSLTKKGRILIKRNNLVSYIPSPFNKNSPASIILSFDIPESNRKTRNWLRNQIKIFNYKMLQQSLWIGPGPLPQLFLKRLDKLDIRKNIKIFPINRKHPI